MKDQLQAVGVKRKPRFFDEGEATEADLLRFGLCARSWKWHWSRFEEGKGYDPWHDIKPHEKQQEFHNLCGRIRDSGNDVRFAGFIGGIGSGKSVTGCAEAVKWLMAHPGITGIIAANSYKQLTQSTIPAFFDVLQEGAIHSHNKGRQEVKLTNGSTVFFRTTTNPDSIRGIDAAFFMLDEGAYAPSKAWDILVGRLRQVGYPQGGWVTTTPNGHNWVFQMFASGDSPDGYDWVRVSAEDNPWLEADYIESLKRTYGDSQFAAQEIHGEFVLLEGLVYPDFSFDKHIVDLEFVTDTPKGKDPYWVDHTYDRRFRPSQVMYLVDWGYSNPLVCLLCLVDSDERLIVAGEYYKSQALAKEMGTTVWNDWVHKHGKGIMICDPSEPDEIDKLARIGFNSKGGNNAVMTGIQEVTKRLQVKEDGLPRLMVSGDCENILREFRQYVYPEKKEGKAASEKPVEEKDHALDALRYGAMELHRGPTVKPLHASDLDLVL